MAKKQSLSKSSNKRFKSSNSSSGKKTQSQPKSSRPLSPSPEGEDSRAGGIPVPLQQRILDVFQTSFAGLFQPAPISDDDARGDGLALTPLLQEMKAALFARDFAAAFENARPALLEAYAVRWSPTRALGYADILAGLASHLESIVSSADVVSVHGCTESGRRRRRRSSAHGHPAEGENEGSCESMEGTGSKETDSVGKRLKVLSIGGGAAEMAAVAAFLTRHNTNPTCSQEGPQDGSENLDVGEITLLDSAPWSPVTKTLYSHFTTPPPLSKYASASAKAANTALIPPTQFVSTFIQADVLSMSKAELERHFAGSDTVDQGQPQRPLLITLLFTLNELYTRSGIGKTTAFLLNLTAVVPSGSLLLVVDSPGSYSQAAVGKDSKKYPMHWLLDHALLKRGRGQKKEEGDGERKDEGEGKGSNGSGAENDCAWEKLEENESVWFRLSDALQYPIQLENMRYQMHLYKATKA